MISEVARRYAKALFDLTLQTKNQETVIAELRSFSEALASDKNLQSFFSAHVVPVEHKEAALKAALSGKVQPVLLDMLKLMATNNRLDIAAEFTAAYQLLVDEKNGVTNGTVRSARPLSADARRRLEETVTKVTKKKVILSFKEDPKLLAGMVAQVGGWTFDDTLETHLTHMSEDLNRRAH